MPMWMQLLVITSVLLFCGALVITYLINRITNAERAEQRAMAARAQRLMRRAS